MGAVAPSTVASSSRQGAYQRWGAGQGEYLAYPFRVGFREPSPFMLTGLGPAGFHLHVCTLRLRRPGPDDPAITSLPCSAGSSYDLVLG